MWLWIFCLPLAVLLFGTVFLILHSVSPLNSKVTVSPISVKTKLMIFGIIAFSFLTLTLPFSNISNDFSEGEASLAMAISGLVAIAATECGYFLSKKSKWFRLLMFTTAIIGTLFIELALVVGYIATLPSGSVT